MKSFSQHFGAGWPQQLSDEVPDDAMKDDSSRQTVLAYNFLFGFFLLLAVFGAVNIYLAHKIRKFSKPILTFYLMSETVICFRIVLFADPFFHWNEVTYVVMLISMPSYLYLLVGLSQVMLTVESIIKYRIFKVKMQEAITNCALKHKVQKNQKIIDYSYWFLYIFMAIIIAFFTIADVTCREKNC